MIGGLIATAALLVANGVFVALEFALIAARRTRLQPLADEGNRRARLALRATRELNVELAAAQLGVTVASLALGYIAEPTLSHLIVSALGGAVTLPDSVAHTIAFIVALVIVSVLHMVIGEMVPKNLVLANPERSLMWLAWPNRAYTWLFGPVVRTLNVVANAGVRALGVEPTDEIDDVHTAEGLGFLVSASHDEGLIDEFAHDLLSGVLRLGSRPVTDVMVPWKDVTAMARTATVRDLERAWTATGYTRLPIVDNDGLPVGFLHAKDLLSVEPGDADRPVPIGRLRRIVLVEAQQTLEDVLLAMRWSGLHMGVVRAEDGQPLGLVTLEDVLEELVGDIRDESDRS